MKINNHNARMIHEPLKTLVIGLIKLQIIFIALWQYRSIRESRVVLINLKRLLHDFQGEMQMSRFVFTGKKFYYNMHFPGFPSKIQIKNQLGELHRLRPVRSFHNRLRILFLNITNQCPLRCQHCFELKNLNKPDPLETKDYIRILSKFTAQGIGQVHLSGGEPLMTYDRLLEITRFLKGKCETWIATSGIGLTGERATELSKAGLTGAAISVDHYEPAIHNQFRGSGNAFGLAMEATENSLKAGLITCWSVCTTREFLTEENLYRYASLAASKGVHFIQLLEPVPVGGFEGQDVLLDKARFALLEHFYFDYNSDKSLKDNPLIVYHGYYQRKMGCMGNGDRYLAIDAWGNIQSCPFCRNEFRISALENKVEELLSSLPIESCIMERS